VIKINIFEAEKYLNEILNPENYEDYCYNGMQIEGCHEVKKIALGVSFNEEFVNKAIEKNCQMLLVHHGIFGKNFMSLKGHLKRRVEKVIKNDLTLFGYHLPLDMNEKYGNNISILNLLNLNLKEKYSYGFIGNYEEKILFESFVEKLYEIIPNKNFKIYKNNDYVKNVCVISGGGASEFLGLEFKNIDTYITGQVEEYIQNYTKEFGMNYICAGHYTTEIFGVKNLGELLKKKFNVETEFIDVYNDV
jgi:dinuclear metal center YbgI/SA1388 family protein